MKPESTLILNSDSESLPAVLFDDETSRSIACAILAGGKSRRFGSDKANARLLDGTLLERTRGTIRDLGIEPMVVGRGLLPDSREGMGPLGGLETAIRSMPSHSTHLLVIAVDMPGLNARFLRAILRGPVADVVLPDDGERLHPICALWDRRMLSDITKALDNDHRSLHWVLDRITVARLDAGYFRRHGVYNMGRVLANINHPGDLERFLDGDDA